MSQNILKSQRKLEIWYRRSQEVKKKMQPCHYVWNGPLYTGRSVVVIQFFTLSFLSEQDLNCYSVMFACWKSAYLHFDINKHNGNLSWNFSFKLKTLTIGGVQWFLMTVMLSVTPSKKTAKAGSCICWPTASTVSKIASICSSWDPATRPTQHLLAKSIPCVPGLKPTELEFDKDIWWYGSSWVYLKQ